jgi:hypothetical protein
MDATTCIVIIATLETAVIVIVVALAWRYGSARAWPPVPAWAVVALSVASVVIIWWINKPIEGAIPRARDVHTWPDRRRYLGDSSAAGCGVHGVHPSATTCPPPQWRPFGRAR